MIKKTVFSIITLMAIQSSVALAFEKPDRLKWLRNTQDINQCFDIADDVAAIPREENRLLECIKRFNGSFDKRYCYMAVDKFTTPRGKRLAKHICESYEPPVTIPVINPIFRDQLEREGTINSGTQLNSSSSNEQFPVIEVDTDQAL